LQLWKLQHPHLKINYLKKCEKIDKMKGRSESEMVCGGDLKDIGVEGGGKGVGPTIQDLRFLTTIN